MFYSLKQKIPWHLVLFFLAIAVFIVYFATSGGATPYFYFTRLADAFLHGKYYLDSDPSWLNELIPIGVDKFAVVYPPAPAIIAVPFVLIYGTNFQQQILSQIMGTVAAYTWGIIAYREAIKNQNSNSKLISFWMLLVAAFGSIVWFMSSNGSVWFTGQVSAYLFITLTIYESLNKKRIPFLILYFGMACLSRLQVVLTLPLIIYLNWEQFKNLKKFLSFGLGMSFFGIIYGVYNYLRFGSFIETGYGLIPGVLKEPWYQKGIFNIENIPDHLRVMFLSIPIFLKKYPFVKPSWGGLSILITSPVFLYSLFANLKKKEILFTWLSIILIALVVMSHGTTGFAQFGYRFAVDFYPLVLFLIVRVVDKKKLKWHHWILLSTSILVNLWGVIFINKLGLIGW
jgi:hypothetical protein